MISKGLQIISSTEEASLRERWSLLLPFHSAAFVAFVRAEDFANFDDEANEPGFFVSFFDILP